MMLWQVWRNELKQFDSWHLELEHGENKENKVFQKHADWLRGVSKCCFSHSRWCWNLVKVINITDCFLLTVNLMKNIVMDPIVGCNFKISMSYWWESKKLNILRYKVQQEQIKQHSFTPYLPNNSLNAMASNQKSRLADERQYFRRHGLTSSAELHSTQTIKTINSLSSQGKLQKYWEPSHCLSLFK